MLDLPMIPDTDDALAQPTRARAFALLSELRRPATTSELAESLQLHPNGVRLHLERLERAGLVSRARVLQARGRPPDAWAIAPGALPGGRPPRAYRNLGRWLARALKAGGGLRGVETTGREIGRELAPVDARSDPDALGVALTALGFAPVVENRTSDQMTIRLGNCPFRDAVHENQPAVCTLHRGITRGLLDVLVPGAELTEFAPRDPDRAGCLVAVRSPARSTTAAT